MLEFLGHHDSYRGRYISLNHRMLRAVY